MPPSPPVARCNGLTASTQGREWSVTAGPRPARAPGRDRAASDWHKARRGRPCAGGSQDHRLARGERFGSQTGAAARATAEAGGSPQGKHQVPSDAKPTLRRSEGARPFPPRPRGKGAPGAPCIPESRGSGRSAAGALWTEGRPLRPRTERQCHRMDAAAGGGVKAPDQSARVVSSRQRPPGKSRISGSRVRSRSAAGTLWPEGRPHWHGQYAKGTVRARRNGGGVAAFGRRPTAPGAAGCPAQSAPGAPRISGSRRPGRSSACAHWRKCPSLRPGHEHQRHPPGAVARRRGGGGVSDRERRGDPGSLPAGRGPFWPASARRPHGAGRRGRAGPPASSSRCSGSGRSSTAPSSAGWR